MAKAEIPIAEALRRLRLFNEKAEKLQRSSFVPKVFHEDHGITILFGEDKPLTVEKRGADEESTDALSLTLRFFFNERDNITLEQMAALYESLPIAAEEKGKVRDAFTRYHAFLDASIGVVFQGTTLTNRVIFETVLYGHLAHTNADKRSVYEGWVAPAPFGDMVKFYYEEVVARVIQVVVALQQFNEPIIRQLESDAAVPMK
jgi:hypothetical protein